MTDDPAPPLQPPDVLGGIGKLREALAAMRNLEHLLGSAQVGPRVLAQILPELQQNSATWKTEASHLFALLADSKGHCQLDEFERFALQLLEEFASCLRNVDRTVTAARPRLTLERNVRRLTPPIAAVVEHLDLLIEAQTSRGVPSYLKELLHARPDVSPGAWVEVPVSGDLDSIEVSLPARVVLRALGALVSCAPPGAGLVIATEDDACGVTIESGVHPRLVAELPVIACIPQTVSVVRCALGRYGVIASEDGLRLRFARDDTFL